MKSILEDTYPQSIFSPIAPSGYIFHYFAVIDLIRFTITTFITIATTATLTLEMIMIVLIRYDYYHYVSAPWTLDPTTIYILDEGIDLIF